MKSCITMSVAALAFAASDADAFFMPAGAIAGGASSTSLSSSAARSAKQALGTSRSHGSGCSCASCAPSAFHGTRCTCPCCSPSAVVSGRSHGSGCRCGSCSVRMQAHGEGCGCGDCSPTVARAFHGTSCTCFACGSAAHGASCSCAACAGTGGCRRRAASSLTVMMGAASDQVSELGEAATALRQRLADEPEAVVFGDTMAAVSESFDYTPKRFVNGVTSSEAGSNEGSCKVFAFGKIAGLSAAETLACFGEHYLSVVEDPSGDSHGNIRAFMENGWEGVSFPDGQPLSPKS